MADENSTVIITKNFAMGAAKCGIVVGVRGVRQNDTFRLYQDEEMILGRDGKQQKLEKNKWVRIERDTLIQLANDKCSFMLL